MLRCAAVGSVVSRRFAGRSDSPSWSLLKALPMSACGADTTLGLDLRTSLLPVVFPLLSEGRLQSGCGPVAKRSPMEKERLGISPCPKPETC